MPHLSSFEEFTNEEGRVQGIDKEWAQRFREAWARGFQEGWAQGILEGAARVLPLTLKFRFGEDGIRYADELKARPLTEWVEKLEANIRFAQTLDELKAAIG
jgi:hypothetical protein